ncbi:GNAT family N-acetyltransferase [Clostridium swellfunianum]|uniref:GNAT family N-acetyltransferase n=1 Tax=Clostridium swellfunianum TaxID=1367462 RepID=UPI003D7C21CA
MAGRSLYLFKLIKLKRLVAIAYPNNAKSRKVIEKLGFKYRGEQEHFGSNFSYYELEQLDR